MIENKEEYKKKFKELTDAMNAQFEVVSTVGHLQTLYGMDAKLSDIKKTAEADANKAMNEMTIKVDFDRSDDRSIWERLFDDAMDHADVNTITLTMINKRGMIARYIVDHAEETL